jgi:cyclopropane fatty-acyl-phospholipid synthase-like methyltransferase
MLFNSPVSEEKANLLINILNVKSTGKVIDIGCGDGEFLVRIQKSSGAECLGLDIDSSCINIAEQKVLQYNLGEKLCFQLADIQDVKIEKNSYQLAICIGSTHAFGQGEIAYTNSLKQMRELVKPNGLILIGEGYWKQKPDQEYLDFIGEPVGVYNSHEQNIQLAESLGLIPLYVTNSNQDEWDHFEWCFKIKAERRVIAEPDNEEAKKKLQAVRQWNNYYRKFGRTTMGFGFYLFMKP